jgi:N-acyl-D-amino-acid deacylase
MPIERIVRKMNGATADRHQIPERGYIRPGYKDDITVIDLDHIKVDEKVPDRKPEGIEYVYINGQPVMVKGQYQSSKAGEVLLKPRTDENR